MSILIGPSFSKKFVKKSSSIENVANIVVTAFIREEKEDFRKQPVIVGTLKNILKVPNNRAPKKYKQITNVEHASPDSGKLEEPKS